VDEEQQNKTSARLCAKSGDTRIVLQEVRSLALDFGCVTADLAGSIGMANMTGMADTAGMADMAGMADTAGMAVQSRIHPLNRGNSRSI
jgi:hypothetical protein